MVVMPDAPHVSYFLEVYPREGTALSGTVQGLVLRADGRQLAAVPLQQLSNVTEPFPVAGSMSVAGLPPGSYRFDVRLELGDSVVVRSHPFQVMGSVVAGGNLPAFYANIPDEQLPQFEAVRTWLSKSEGDLYMGLSPAGKREFLARQFAREEPTPDDAQESAIDAFLQRSQVVYERYSEKAGRGAQPGYLTDRGRIYMLHGEPTNIVTRPSPINGAPYEIWHYAATQRLVYLFADETRMRNYRLIYTNDPQEQGVADWTRRVGPEAVRDMWTMGFRVEGADPNVPPLE
jgi:GWxTD domain-containing protein